MYTSFQFTFTLYLQFLIIICSNKIAVIHLFSLESITMIFETVKDSIKRKYTHA